MVLREEWTQKASVFGVRLKDYVPIFMVKTEELPYGGFDIEVDRGCCPSSIEVDRTNLTARIVPTRTNAQRR
jgi:hypothetical protein